MATDPLSYRSSKTSRGDPQTPTFPYLGMPRVHLNQRYLDGLKAPHPSGKQVIFWDRSTPGFGVQVSGSTNQMTYKAQRTLPNGRDRRVSIGTVGHITLAAARDEARKLIHQMRQGIDPKAAPHNTAAGNQGCRRDRHSPDREPRSIGARRVAVVAGR